jgi:hypothetical protein
MTSSPKSEAAVATSCGGVYTDSRCGVATPMFDVDAGHYFVIVSTYDPRPASYSLTVFSFPERVRLSRLGGPEGDGAG